MEHLGSVRLLNEFTPFGAFLFHVPWIYRVSLYYRGIMYLYYIILHIILCLSSY